MIVPFVGCAGVGKNTIIQKLLEDYPEKYDTFCTLTTRQPREGESEGHPYHFVSKSEFEKLLAEGEIYEWQIIHNSNYYGGSRKVLRNHLQNGKMLIKDIDVLGARTYKEKVSDLSRVISVFLYVEDLNVLLDRMRVRGDSEEDIAGRARRFEMEMLNAADSEYMVNNEKITDTALAVDALLTNEDRFGGIYRPCVYLGIPDETEIRAEIDKHKNAPFEPVEILFNGSEMLITNGAARYAAAKRMKAFIQKKVRYVTDTSLKSADISFEDWKKLIL